METTVFEFAGEDKPGLLAEVTELLSQNGCNVRSAAVSFSLGIPPLMHYAACFLYHAGMFQMVEGVCLQHVISCMLFAGVDL